MVRDLFDSLLPSMPPGFGIGLGFVLGLAIGSYLATILWRWPRGQSANIGRSRCDGCGRRLSWYELMPLLGPVLAGGKCRSCGHRIDWRHSLFELTCGILGAYCFGVGMAWLAPLGWLLILLAWFDARHLWLPDSIVATLAALALVTPAPDALPLMQKLLGGAIGFGTLWLVAATYRRLRGRDGLGGGDAKLFGAIGLWVGALDLPLVLLVACAIGLADVGVRLASGHNTKMLRLPLGTYLCGTVIGLIVLSPIRGMLSLFGLACNQN